MSYNPDRINIHELTVEEPKKQEGLPFDSDTEITEMEWREMKDQLQYYQDNFEDANFRSLAMALKILDPKIDFGINQDVWFSRLKRKLEELKQSGVTNWWDFAKQAAVIKILSPSFTLDQSDLQGLKTELEDRKKREREKAGTTRFAEYVVALKILDPKIDLDLNQLDWKRMKDSLEQHRKGASEGESIHWSSFARQAMYMKIIDTNIDLHLDIASWKGMRDWANDAKKSQQGPFPWRALEMKILAAERVEVTDEGLIITMPKRKESIKPEIPPIPEAKQF